MVTRICRQIKTPDWVRISLSIDPDVWDKFKAKAAKNGEKNLSALVESLMTCYTYDTCDECPSYQELPSEEKRKIKGKGGIVGKWDMVESEEERAAKRSRSDRSSKKSTRG